MSLLLHISDTHFGTEQPPVLQALRVLARDRRPDALIFSGDVTQRARRAQFAAAARFVESLGITRRMALPGNHDIPLFNVAARVLQPYGGYVRAFGHDLEPVLQGADFVAIGVNTTRPRRHKDGEVSAAQVERVAALLRKARPGQLRIVVTHQPCALPAAHDETDRLRGADPAIRAWADAGADLVLGGHIHLPYVLDLSQQPWAASRRMWCVQAGTAVSSRVRHAIANSVNLIQWKAPAAGESRMCIVERCDFDATRGRFVCAPAEELLLA
ncbi:MAG: metallophosphoesterase [Pseudomonadota bacterium]